MFVDRVIEGKKNTPFSEQFCGLKPQTAGAMTLLETHSPASFIAHTICALASVGMTTSTSSEAKGEIQKQTIQLTIKLSTTIYKLFEKSSLPLDSLHIKKRLSQREY